MSERSFVASCLVRLGYSHDKAESLVQGALDEHAHELAEKVRAFDGPTLTMAGRKMAPLGLVADSIDPESDRE